MITIIIEQAVVIEMISLAVESTVIIHTYERIVDLTKPVNPAMLVLESLDRVYVL